MCKANREVRFDRHPIASDGDSHRPNHYFWARIKMELVMATDPDFADVDGDGDEEANCVDADSNVNMDRVTELSLGLSYDHTWSLARMRFCGHIYYLVLDNIRVLCWLGNLAGDQAWE